MVPVMASLKSMKIKFFKSTDRKPKIADTDLGFGTHFTDHMFMMDYETTNGWHDPRIVPYQPLSLEPSASVFHYAQEVFEGLKAYRTNQDEILLFRPLANAKRLNQSSQRMCLPSINEQFFVTAIKELVRVDKDWVPRKKGTSLYIRPFIIAIDPFLGVRQANKYLFIVILSPVANYYQKGLSPVKIWVEDKYVRAVVGGTGTAKTGGNYAASIIAQKEAKQRGYDQVLWLDGVQRRYVEEVGTMNVFFKINNQIITPALNGSILEGVTRRSVIELLEHNGYTVEQRQIGIDELVKAHQAGHLEEAFGTGTAATISSIGTLSYQGQTMVIGGGQIGAVTQKVYDDLLGIQSGYLIDEYGWTETV